MKICVIGAGYVGLVTAACLAKIGHNVACVERDSSRVDNLLRGVCPIYEPGLAEIIENMQQQGTLRFTVDMKDAVQSADAIFIAVGTPSRDDGSSDISQVLNCGSQVAAYAEHGAVIITKSTVPVGTNKVIRRIVQSIRPNAKLKVASNPEFLREGSALRDFDEPDRIVIGFREKSAGDILEKIYKPITEKGFQLVQTSCENAELIKHASNAFLAMKVTFANELADLCEAAGGQMEDVVRGLGLDGRIGPKFLNAGPGYGGSCFPKDTRAMAHMGKKLGARQTLVEAVIERNEARKHQIAQRILNMLGANANNKCVCVWGIAFKANTDDIRDAPALTIIKHLEDAGVKVRAHDPIAMNAARKALPKTRFFATPQEAAQGADMIVVLTEWAEYKDVAFKPLADVVKGRLIADFRNLLPRKAVTVAGFQLFTIGKGMDRPSRPVNRRIKILTNEFHDRRGVSL